MVPLEPLLRCCLSTACQCRGLAIASALLEPYRLNYSMLLIKMLLLMLMLTRCWWLLVNDLEVMTGDNKLLG